MEEDGDRGVAGRGGVRKSRVDLWCSRKVALGRLIENGSGGGREWLGTGWTGRCDGSGRCRTGHGYCTCTVLQDMMM